MEPTNPGSFGSTIGGGEAIKAALTSRGMNPGILNQISPASANAPQNLPPQPVGANPPSAIPGQTPQRQPLPTSGQPGGNIGLPPSSAEAKVIVSALSKRLSTLGELQAQGIS